MCAADSQTVPGLPRLVVNIMVDQLRSDYLETYSGLYGSGGFRRLMGEGIVFSHAEYPFSRPDMASATACVQSGCSPYDNGIPSRRWLDRGSLLPVYCVDDAEYKGVFTSDCSSPSRLGVSTIGDEMKVSTDGRALVYSLAPFRDAAILSAGHAADGAFWMNPENGGWCTTSYYRNVPSWLGGYNKRIVSGSVSGGQKSSNAGSSIETNDEVNSFVKYCLQFTGLGLDDVPDLLNVTYSAACSQEVSPGRNVCQETYYRLDYDIEELINTVEERVGKGNVLFVLTGSGHVDESGASDLSKFRIPSGTFDMLRARMLLNMYLIAVYGEGQWIEAVLGDELYLNLKLIEQRNLNLTEVLDRCSSFLIQLSGVKDVYTRERLGLGAWTPGISRLRNAFNPHCSGDILIQIAPGWTLVNESTGERWVSRESYIGFPLVFMGPGTARGRVETPVTVDRIAPTVCGALRIRAPNGCGAAPLELVR